MTLKNQGCGSKILWLFYYCKFERNRDILNSKSPCLGTRIKLRKTLKRLLNSFKLHIVFKRQRKLSNVFRFKDPLLFNLLSGVVYKYTCGRCSFSYYGEADRHLKVRSGEHIGISPLRFKKTVTPKKSAIRDHLLSCNNIPCFE